MKLARDNKVAPDGLRFERLYGKLHDLFPKEVPALLHGDLWHGNFICDADGRPALIDPAVYYGHREMDIAMLHLFGDAEPEFLASYNAERLLEKAWEERVDLCNLYPLLVHVNLFGGHYVLGWRGVEAVGVSAGCPKNGSGPMDTTLQQTTRSPKPYRSCAPHPPGPRSCTRYRPRPRNRLPLRLLVCCLLCGSSKHLSGRV